jgi:hypothetical protein
MLISLAVALGLTLPQAGDPSTRSPSEAFIAAIDRVCPIYMKSSGLTAADMVLLEAEMAMRAGVVGRMRQGAPPPQIMLQAGPDFCLVMGMGNDSTGSIGATRSELSDAATAWLTSPTSGWTSTPSHDRPGRYTSTDGRYILLLIDDAEENFPTVMIEAVTPSFLTDADIDSQARGQASARPTDQAILEAIDTLCAVAATSAWNTIDRGEVMIRHSGDSRLTVDYNSNADCTIRVVGEDAAAVAMALGQRLDALDSGWTRITHAWMTFSDGGPMGREMQGNYGHNDGREFSIILDEGEAQVILWQPKPHSAP